MDDKTILRIEEKFLISPAEKDELLSRVQKHLEKDEYFKEEVLSLYFDTKNYNLAINSIERPAFREKIRVRSYNTPKLSSPVFFEIKSKYAAKNKKKLGNKRRLVIPLQSCYDFFEHGADLEAIAARASDNNPNQLQIARELTYLANFYQLEPNVLIAADRTAYVDKADKNFRLTFDEHLRFRTNDLCLEHGSRGKRYFNITKLDDRHKNIIMEVKTMHAMPPWFVAELSRQKLYPAQFSKYGKIYQTIIERNQNV